MGEVNDNTRRDRIARLFGATRDSVLLPKLMAAPACAHHLVPVLYPIAKCRGLANDIYKVMGSRIADLNVDLSAQYFRINASNALKGLTLDVVDAMFAIIEDFLDLGRDMRTAPDGYAKVRHDFVSHVGITGQAHAVATASNYYVEVVEACRRRSSQRMIALPTVLERLGFERGDIEGVCLAADSERGEVYDKAFGLLTGLLEGYDGSGEMRGACKITRAAAEFLHRVLQDLALARKAAGTSFKLLFSDEAGVGPRQGQSTRSLWLDSGNFISHHDFSSAAAA